MDHKINNKWIGAMLVQIVIVLLSLTLFMAVETPQFTGFLSAEPLFSAGPAQEMINETPLGGTTGC